MPLRWAWVLGFALLAPVALPAGGADLRLPSPRRRGRAAPLLSSPGDDLQVTPLQQAPSLVKLKAGTPMEVLRHWTAPDGQRWAYVQVLCGYGFGVGQILKRGWINV